MVAAGYRFGCHPRNVADREALDEHFGSFVNDDHGEYAIQAGRSIVVELQNGARMFVRRLIRR
jgi:hypothetical protein